MHVAQMVEYLHAGRVVFHDGDSEIAPGITRSSRRRPRARPAGRASEHEARACGAGVRRRWHMPEQFVDYRVSPALVDAEAMLRGYDRLRQLAASEDHIVTGHDPLTTELYPRVPGIEAVVLRLHEEPVKTIREAIGARWSG